MPGGLLKLRDYALNTPLSSMIVILLIMLLVSYFYIKDPYQQVPGVGDMNFFIHEFGHIISMSSSSALVLAGSGTVFQLLLPLIATIYYFFKGRYIESALFLCWLGTNLSYTGIYMMDTIKRTMPMAQIFGPNTKHDWEVIFGHFDLTIYAVDIGGYVLKFAQGVMVVACVYVGWLVVYKCLHLGKFKYVEKR